MDITAQAAINLLVIVVVVGTRTIVSYNLSCSMGMLMAELLVQAGGTRSWSSRVWRFLLVYSYGRRPFVLTMTLFRDSEAPVVDGCLPVKSSQ